MVFEAKRRRRRADPCPEPGCQGGLTGTHCEDCRQERRADLMECRRRRNRAWWQTHEDEGKQACLGCVHRGSGPKGTVLNPTRIQTVPLGQLYCSSACRKLVERFAARGGCFEGMGMTVRDGLVVPLQAPLAS